MKKLILLTTLLIPFIMFSQHQLGADIDGEAAGDISGYSVSIDSDGSHVAIGAYANDGTGSGAGHVRIYSWDGTNWSKVGNDIDGEAAGDLSGLSVSIDSDGSHVAIGAYANDGTGSDAGHVRIYSWDGTNWSKVGNDIDGEAAGDYSGVSVSIDSDGSHVAIGAYENDGTVSNAGHVRIYSWDGTNWSKVGNDIDGEAAGDQSGVSVSIDSDGSHVAIGASANGGTGSAAGHVRIYSWDGTNWSKVGNDIDGEAAYDRSGVSVSIDSDGSHVAIGASANDGTGSNAGHVRIYSWDGTNWSKVGNDIDGEAAGDYSGVSVSIDSDGSHVAIGAYANGGTGDAAGHVRIYSWDGTNWSKVGNDIDGEAAGDQSGVSVSIDSDGSHVAIGASANDGTGSNAGHVRVLAPYGVTGDSPDNTLTATSLTTSGATTAGSLTVDSVVIDGTTIGHSSDTDLMTLASGSLTVAGDVILSSDARLKSNIVTLGPTLISLMQLDAKRYTMKADKGQKQKIGLLAQEVQKVFPELVSEDKNGMLAVNYQALVPVLINALKEQEGKIKAQEKEMTEFEDIIPRLLKQIKNLKTITNN